MPPFIVLEGPDGCGKSTVSAPLAERLGAARLSTPGQGLERVRETVDACLGQDGLARQLFYAAAVARASTEAGRLRATGRPVVIDRYWLSTCAYARLRGSFTPLPEVERSLLVPDVTVFLTIDEPSRVARMLKRGMSAEDATTILCRDRLERIYAELLESSPLSGRVVRIDTGRLDPEGCADAIVACLRELAA